MSYTITIVLTDEQKDALLSPGELSMSEVSSLQDYFEDEIVGKADQAIISVNKKKIINAADQMAPGAGASFLERFNRASPEVQASIIAQLPE